MKKQFSTKKALMLSVLSLCLCCAMLVGTTFAWFTDSVTSKGNIIQTGTLDVEMFWTNADVAVPAKGDAAWIDASAGAMFKADTLWEPGYVEAKHILIANEGSLALNYKLRIVANGVVSKLADVIDVYYVKDATAAVTRDNLGTKLGTLADVLGTDNNLAKTISGSLLAGKTATWSLVLKMQESAGNEYQNLAIGTDFSVELIATQKSEESDSFGPDYDKDSVVTFPEVPAALVRPLTKLAVSTDGKMNSNFGGINLSDYGVDELDVGYQFEPTMSAQDALNSDYRYWHADFVISADRTVAANSMALAGYYSFFCEDFNDGKWIALASPDAIAANTEIRLVGSMGGGGITVNWEELCEYGNDGKGFQCGAVDLDGSNEGTTITVELRMYETYPDGHTHHNDGSECNLNSKNCEVGPDAYITVGVFTHTFGGDYVTLEDGTVLFNANDGEVVLYDTSDVTATEYTVPAGVTALGSYSINKNFKTVTIPATVTDFGATGVSATGASSGAFKDTAVETVVLSEGMTEIPAAAFNGAKSLKSVNIPSTVETIGVNAFRLTALETLTVPATVETISYGAFRDMDSLTTVTIEGDVHIPNYAFRDCSALRTVYINGENVTVGSNMAFANQSSNNPGTNNITFYVKNEAVAAQVRVCMGAGTNFWIYVDEQEVTVVRNNEELLSAIQVATGETKTILLADGTYSSDLKLTVTDIGQAQCENLVIKAAGENVIFTGTTTLGYRNQGTGSAMYNANVVFEGVTFDHANAETNSLDIQDVKSLTLKNCTIIGDGEYGITSARGNATGTSKIVGCTFENAGMQILGNFGTGLVIDDCIFNDSRINVQAGNLVTVQNCTFNATATNVNDNFYLIRSNDDAMVIDKCTFNVDVDATGSLADGKYWTIFCPRNVGSRTWTVTDVKVNLTEDAMNSALTVVNNLTTTPANAPARITITGLTSESNDVAELVAKSAGYVIVDGVTYLNGVAQ